MGLIIMRLALAVLAVMLIAVSTAYAQGNNGNINPRWKKIEIPSIEPNAGLTTRLGAGQSNYWRSPDQSSIS
jgi:hypothetical protein